MRFRYSKQAYKVLWFLILMNWATVMLAIKIEGGSPLELFFIMNGVLTFAILVVLAILDIIEWRYPKR